VSQTPPKKRVRRDTSKDYINNAKMLAAFRDRKPLVTAAKESGEIKPQVSKYLGECIYSIANNLSRKGNFAGYSFRDEMVSDAIENCLMYIDTFDPDHPKANPFSFFTLTCWRAFIRRIQKEKKQTYIKMKLSEQVEMTSLEGSGAGTKIDYDRLEAVEKSLKIRKDEEDV
jgi:hypothetical protein